MKSKQISVDAFSGRMEAPRRSLSGLRIFPAREKIKKPAGTDSGGRIMLCKGELIGLLIVLLFHRFFLFPFIGFVFFFHGVRFRHFLRFHGILLKRVFRFV